MVITNGPVQATFDEDSFMYAVGGDRTGRWQLPPDRAITRSGISDKSSQLQGIDHTTPSRGAHMRSASLHWTREWLVASCRGRGWGEGGLFRIVRGENQSEIEGFAIGTSSSLVFRRGVVCTFRSLKRRRDANRFQIDFQPPEDSSITRRLQHHQKTPASPEDSSITR
ncbi:unnamed protein product [Heligmosomoides polygyrus]|uniref:Uncharacterized protein n=1 Tax=Heligmosomoides polygyrus TaxID=6339 RepID=A0A183FKH2_HELPZ|nr:unnamed protein product [Heligmosomoides polygyrus]